MRIPPESGFNDHAEATYLRRYTHSPSALRTIFREPISARLKKYDTEFLKTFSNIPEYTIVRSKKKLPEDAHYVVKLTERTYAFTETREAVRFIEHVAELYDALLTSKPVSRRKQVLHAYPISTLLRDLLKLRSAESSEYHYLKRHIPSSHLKFLLELGVLRKVVIDWAWPKKTFVFVPLL